MVAAINICICDKDGRRPSSTPAHFEAPDALGSRERGGRILMPAEFQFRALGMLVGKKVKMATATNGGLNLPAANTATNSFESDSHSTSGLCEVIFSPCNVSVDCKCFQMRA